MPRACPTACIANIYADCSSTMICSRDVTRSGSADRSQRYSRADVFVVATECDHVAPWRSVYKINLVTDTDVTFVLTNGGHNAGILSEPGHAHRHYRLSHRAANAPYVDPRNWFASAAPIQGSWWPAWAHWLERLSVGRMAIPITSSYKEAPSLGAAPGFYVLEH